MSLLPLDFSESRMAPFAHQVIDTQSLIDHAYFFIASEMRTGKTKIVIDAAQFLFRMGIIDRVIVVAPAPVRDVWFDPEFGELAKHLWLSMPAKITEFHSELRQWTFGPPADRQLKWIITNYEYIRDEARLKPLLPYATEKTLLVLDESSAIASHKSLQYKACFKLRYRKNTPKLLQLRCSRIVELNGTPFDTPLNLFSQGNILHPKILDCPYITYFRSRYAKMGGFRVGGRPVQIIGWTNLEDLQSRFKPYTIRRLQKDCLDLPEKLPPVTLHPKLTTPTWDAYCQMRDDMVVLLKSGDASLAPQTITKIMRLAQITSGFLGGVGDNGLDDDWTEDLDELPALPDSPPYPILPALPSEAVSPSVREIGREKLDVVLWLLQQQIEKDPNIKIVTWCRFKPELLRLLAEVRKLYPNMIVQPLMGGQKKADRQIVLRLLDPITAPAGPVFVGGTYGTGSFGLNFTASHTNINCSYDYSLRKFLQSGDRVYGPGQVHPISYFDIVATGPKGQRTIDHIIVKARRAKDDISTWTTNAWVQALIEE